MSNHEEEKDNLDFVFYIVALVSGMFVGLILDKGFTWIFVGGVLGLLTAALFLSVFVRGREQR